jgi:hypothetical protein
MENSDMRDLVFDKTEKGRQEIASRTRQLSPRLRSMLVVIDGKHSGRDLIEHYSWLGLNDEILSRLQKEGYIQSVYALSGSLSGQSLKRNLSAEVAAPVVAQKKTAEEYCFDEGENQFLAIQQFYLDTIKNVIGLRGFALQVRVKKARSIDDFRALRIPYLEAAYNAKGVDATRNLRDRLDQLLNLVHPPCNANSTPIH